MPSAVKSGYGLDCPVAHTLDIVGERWTFLVLRDLLREGPRKFQDLETSLTGIGPNTLSARLKRLEEAGIVERRFYEQHPPRAEYVLTEKGRGLGPVLLALGFDQDEAESKRDERAVILRRLLASKCDTLEAFELADRLFDACPCLVECFRKEGGHILGVGSIRDCRTYSALARGVAI